EKFDALVLDALEPIEARWRHDLTELDVAVDEVPEVHMEIPPTQIDGVLLDGRVPLSRLVPPAWTGTGCPPGRGSCCTADRWRHGPRTRPSCPNSSTTCSSNRSPITPGWSRTSSKVDDGMEVTARPLLVFVHS